MTTTTKTKSNEEAGTSKGKDIVKPKDFTVMVGLNRTDKYEGGRVVNGKIKRGITAEDLRTAALNGLGPYLKMDFPEGAYILINFSVEFPKPDEQEVEEENE